MDYVDGLKRAMWGEYLHNWNQKRLQMTTNQFSCFQKSQYTNTTLGITWWYNLSNKQPRKYAEYTNEKVEKLNILNSWCCNPQKSYNSLFFFTNRQREQRSGILKKVVYDHGPMTAEKWVKHKIISGLKGKTYTCPREKKAVTHIISQQTEQNREEPHNHERKIIQTH